MALDSLIAALKQRYGEATPGSAILANGAQDLLPSGVVHDARITDPHPLYVERADGSRKWDVDGREYIDYVGGHGALILGHGDPHVHAAVADQLANGTHFGACHKLELRWAQLIHDLVPSAEKVRFTSSGTEGTLLALRIARAVTGRPKLLRIRGHFHGWNDHMTGGYMSHFDGSPTIGVVDGIAADTRLVDVEDFAGLEKALADGNVAAVIAEPTGSHFGRIPMTRGFLEAMRSLSEASGTLMILDEVVTGFRVAPGGYQSLVGIKPDLTTLAKIVAGGLPGGAVAGRADLMDVMDVAKFKQYASERVTHQGTYNANPLSAAAGIATLERLRDGTLIAKASAAAASIRDGLNRVFAAHRIPWAAYGDFSALHIFTNPHGRAIDPHTFDASKSVSDQRGPAPNASLISAVRAGLLANGVDVNGQLSGWVSARHDDRDVEETIAAFDKVAVELQQAGAFV